MDFKNTTHIESERLERMFLAGINGWCHKGLRVRVRYSRGADFSGTCYYDSDRIFVNLGRHNKYPYALKTNIARPRSNRTHWWRELYTIKMPRAEELALFIFLHEFYHRLVRRARRNTRQKEGRCDRFAARVLVDNYSLAVRDARGRSVPREAWDFQDLDAFVAAARPRPRKAIGRKTQRPAARDAHPAGPVVPPAGQMTLFPGL